MDSSQLKYYLTIIIMFNLNNLFAEIGPGNNGIEVVLDIPQSSKTGFTADNAF